MYDIDEAVKIIVTEYLRHSLHYLDGNVVTKKFNIEAKGKTLSFTLTYSRHKIEITDIELDGKEVLRNLMGDSPRVH